MQRKSGKWLADWTNEYGLRRRKAFASEDNAKAYSSRMKREAAEKKALRLRVSTDTRSTTKSNSQQTIRQKLEMLESETMILTLELRNAVLQAATDLLRQPIRACEGQQEKRRQSGSN